MRATAHSPGSASQSTRRRRDVERAVRAGDRVAVRVPARVAQLGGDALDEQVRDGVLEHLGLVVHLVPAVAEHLDEERLDEPVPPDHRERVPLARPP